MTMEKNDPDYKPTLDKEGIKQYKHDKKDRLEYESDNVQVNCCDDKNSLNKIFDTIIKFMVKFKQYSSYVSFDENNYKIQLVHKKDITDEDLENIYDTYNSITKHKKRN